MTKQLVISEALHARLRRYATRHGKKLGAIAEEALRRFLRDQRRSLVNDAGLGESGPAAESR